VVLHVIGFEAEGIPYAIGVKNFANLFNHSNIVLDWGFPLRYLIVSPNMHRWHHADTPEAKNKNFCIVFAFIDVLFGTFYLPKGKVPERYGFEGEPPTGFHASFLRMFVYPFQRMGQVAAALARRVASRT
jgi:sterol desaturase/sphingolipid hydroxylase (fatty acid hydroxylase superfamily)